MTAIATVDAIDESPSRQPEATAGPKGSGYGAGVARMAYIIRSFMRLQEQPIEVRAAALELGFAPSTIHRVLDIMLKNGLSSFKPAAAVPGKGPGRGRLYVWSVEGTLEMMESVFGVMPQVCGTPTPGEDPRPQAYPSIFHMGMGQAVYLPAWQIPTSRAA